MVTGREKVGEGTIRKMETRDIATKLQSMEEKDTQKREGQRKLSERNIKKNTFRVLQEEDTELLTLYQTVD